MGKGRAGRTARGLSHGVEGPPGACEGQHLPLANPCIRERNIIWQIKHTMTDGEKYRERKEKAFPLPFLNQGLPFSFCPRPRTFCRGRWLQGSLLEMTTFITSPGRRTSCGLPPVKELGWFCSPTIPGERSGSIHSARQCQRLKH